MERFHISEEALSREAEGTSSCFLGYVVEKPMEAEGGSCRDQAPLPFRGFSAVTSPAPKPKHRSLFARKFGTGKPCEGQKENRSDIENIVENKGEIKAENSAAFESENTQKVLQMSEEEREEALGEILGVLSPENIDFLKRGKRGVDEDSQIPQADLVPLNCSSFDENKKENDEVESWKSSTEILEEVLEEEAVEKGTGGGGDNESLSFHLSEKEAKKMEWMNPVCEDKSADEEAGAKRLTQEGDVDGDPDLPQVMSPEQNRLSFRRRFDFEGREMTEREAEEDSSLFHHGDSPEEAGYTLSELLGCLSRSKFAGQRTVALGVLEGILKMLLEKVKRVRQDVRDADEVSVWVSTLFRVWRVHVRLAVACSDPSLSARKKAWKALKKLEEVHQAILTPVLASHSKRWKFEFSDVLESGLCRLKNEEVKLRRMSGVEGFKQLGTIPEFAHVCFKHLQTKLKDWTSKKGERKGGATNLESGFNKDEEEAYEDLLSLLAIMKSIFQASDPLFVQKFEKVSKRLDLEGVLSPDIAEEEEDDPEVLAAILIPRLKKVEETEEGKPLAPLLEGLKQFHQEMWGAEGRTGCEEEADYKEEALNSLEKVGLRPEFLPFFENPMSKSSLISKPFDNEEADLLLKFLDSSGNMRRDYLWFKLGMLSLFLANGNLSSLSNLDLDRIQESLWRTVEEMQSAVQTEAEEMEALGPYPVVPFPLSFWVDVCRLLISRMMEGGRTAGLLASVLLYVFSLPLFPEVGCRVAIFENWELLALVTKLRIFDFPGSVPLEKVESTLNLLQPKVKPLEHVRLLREAVLKSRDILLDIFPKDDRIFKFLELMLL